MAISLEQAKLNSNDKLEQSVIDEFAKSNFLLNNMLFENTVTPQGSGFLTYAYTRLISQPTADFRAFNAEYVAAEATKERISVDLKPFGGSFKIDRVIASMASIIDEVMLQMKQKVKAATALFNDTVINGDTALNANAFDGLEKALLGSSTEFKPATVLDLSSSAAIDSNYKEFLDILDEFLMGLDGTPSFIGGNTKLIAKLRAVARRAGMYQSSVDNFGKQVEMYGNIPLIDLGSKAGSNDPIVAIDNRPTVSGTANPNLGCTSLYAARFGIDGVHAVSMANESPIRVWLPDFTTAGAVKNGEVEMVAALALKSTKAAGVMRKIKVA